MGRGQRVKDDQSELNAKLVYLGLERDDVKKENDEKVDPVGLVRPTNILSLRLTHAQVFNSQSLVPAQRAFGRQNAKERADDRADCARSQAAYASSHLAEDSSVRNEYRALASVVLKFVRRAVDLTKLQGRSMVYFLQRSDNEAFLVLVLPTTRAATRRWQRT